MLLLNLKLTNGIVVINRRTILGGGCAALLTALNACGGGNSGVAYQPNQSDQDGEEDFEHSYGMATLPASPTLDTDILATATPGQRFTVSVRLGDAAQIGVPVSIYDVNNVLLDEGVTDSDGLYRSQVDGRPFLMAVARSPEGDLYGFEYNNGTKIGPVVDVNLLPTLIANIVQKLKLSPNALDFVVKRFFRIDYDVLLSDLPSASSFLNQDALYAQARRSGLGLQGWLNAKVGEVETAIEQGFDSPSQIETKDAASYLESGASDSCDDVPAYDDEIDENIPTELQELIKKYWPNATKWLAGEAFKLIAKATGVPFIGTVGNFILGALFPSSNPVAEKLDEIDRQIKQLQSSIEELLRRLAIDKFDRTFDSVRDVFNDFHSICTEIRSTDAYYHIPGRQIDDNYRQTMKTQCEALFAMETRLIGVYNKFVGLGSESGAGVLSRWLEVVNNDQFYTSAIQNQYTGLLDYFQSWSTLSYTYLINAYDSYATLTGGAINTSRVGQLHDRLVAQIAKIEKLRPKYLYSEKQFIDVRNNLIWVGRCNLTTAFLDLVPEEVYTGPWTGGRLEKTIRSLMRYDSTDPCESEGSPMGSASLGDDIIDQYDWGLPTKKNLEDSFANVIKEKYGKKYNMDTFSYDHQISRSVSFFFPSSEGGKSQPKPIDVLVRSGGLKPAHVRVYRNTYSWEFDGDIFSFSNLKTVGNMIAAVKNPYAPAFSMSLYLFPVAHAKKEELDLLLPARVYARVINELPI